MDFKLIWTGPAIDDLKEVVAFLALRQGTARARELGFAIFNKAGILTSFPEGGSVLVQKSDPCWRKLIFKTWKIAYKIDWEFHVIYIGVLAEPAAGDEKQGVGGAQQRSVYGNTRAASTDATLLVAPAVGLCKNSIARIWHASRNEIQLGL